MILGLVGQAEAADLGCTESGGVCCLTSASCDQTQPDCDCDGIPDATDTDDDNDGVCDVDISLNVVATGCINRAGGDPSPRNPLVCGDFDMDTCDDCSRGNTCFWDYNDPSNATTEANYLACVTAISDVGGNGLVIGQDGFGPAANFNTSDDGAWFGTNDGECRADADNDGIPDAFDSNPNDPTQCGDSDNDGCEDCSNQVDGLGALADFDLGQQTDPTICANQGFTAPCDIYRNDGPDADGDGFCDVGDDDDGDGVPNSQDSAPNDPWVCGIDADNDGCDDCAFTDGDNPNPDGPDPAGNVPCVPSNQNPGATAGGAGCSHGSTTLPLALLLLAAFLRSRRRRIIH